MAWELEKCLTYHFIAQSSGKSQMVMNEEATMARRGLGKKASNELITKNYNRIFKSTINLNVVIY